MRRVAPGSGRRRVGAVLAKTTIAIAGLCACSGEPAERTKAVEARGKLEQGVAARVGGEIVTVVQVRAMSKARGISYQRARDALVYDALLAAAAREKGLSKRSDVVIRERAELARALLDGIRARAEREPITDEEVGRHTALNWLDLDRPAARRTVHAVAIPKDQTAEAWKKADAVAKRLAEAVRGETNPEEFIKKARAVDAEGLKVVAQVLSPVTEDGRLADLKNRPPPGTPPGRLDDTFVAATFRLGAVNDQVSEIRSTSGTHVIMLTGIQPASVMSFEKRRQLLAEEIRAARVKARMDELLARLSSSTAHEVERNAETILSTLTIPDPDGGS